LLATSVILGLHKRVGNFFAAIDRADKDEEGASHDNKTKGSGRLVAFVVSNNLVYIVEDQVHESIITLQRALDLATTIELDSDLLVHILAQVEDVLLLGPLTLLLSASRAASSTNASASTSGM